jgi:hypothetical protein
MTCRQLAVAFLAASIVGVTLSPAARAQGDSGTPMVGAWELSNAERDKTCTINFKLDAAGPGRALELQKGCVEAFPETRDVVAWTMDKDDTLRLIDAKGKAIFELSEVENGLFEPLRPSQNLVFLQTQAAAEGRERTADAMFGDWAIVRSGGKPICQISLLGEAHDTESFDMKVKPGCDSLVTNFAPKSWRMDRGLLLVLSERSDPWRFEEEESGIWHRIPQGRQPLLLVRQ